MITEESFVDFECPYCGASVSFPQADAGFVRACPDCTQSVIVPDDGSSQGRKLPLPIETPRLRLRRFAPGDWRDLLEFMSQEELFHYIGGGPLDEEQVLQWLEREAHVKLTTPDQVFYLGMELKDGGKLVGYVGLNLTDQTQAMFHAIVNRQYQRQGLATEALQGVLGFCFKEVKLHRVSARCVSQYTPGLKLLEKIGLRREGEFIKNTPSPDGWLNTSWFAILEEEWHPQR